MQRDSSAVPSAERLREHPPSSADANQTCGGSLLGRKLRSLVPVALSGGREWCAQGKVHGQPVGYASECATYGSHVVAACRCKLTSTHHSQPLDLETEVARLRAPSGLAAPTVESHCETGSFPPSPPPPPPPLAHHRPACPFRLEAREHVRHICAVLGTGGSSARCLSPYARP